MKKGLEFNFVWLFALIVGALILFLAIYSASKLIKGSSYEQETITAKQITNIFETAETGLAVGMKYEAITLRDETRIFNTCSNSESFGRQRISISSKIFGSWQEESTRISMINKYVFSNSMEEGKKFYYFAMPLMIPFKLTELIFVSSQRYCFLNAPEEILNEAGFLMANLDANCSPNSIKVCFGRAGCNISISGMCSSNCNTKYDYGIVTKNGKSLGYIGSLIYGAVFSEPELYECNVKRLGKKLGYTADLLKREADFLTGKCGASSSGLARLSNQAKNLESSQDLFSLVDTINAVERDNNGGECKLW